QYQCPRCSTRTCSLQCSKLHKARSQCLGVRDPTAFVKKAQLATPAGIDQDYNFLTGVERAFDKADRDAESRGFDVRNASTRHLAKGSALQQRLQAAGVIIDRAPPVMSRARDNHTRVTNKYVTNLIWTVEWIHGDQSRDLRDCRDVTTLSYAYAELLAAKKLPLRQEQKETLSLKRKRDDRAPERTEETTQVTMPSVMNEPQPEHHSEKDANPAGPAGAAADVFFIDTVPEPPEPHFYLVKPYTSTSRRVLIPLPSSATLAHSLRGQVVLEFPTIQVLPYPWHALPSNFMLEAEYLGESKREEQELDELLKHVQPLGAEGEGVGGGASSDVVQDREIIEMLRKDVGGGS
ncbi:HIT finger domain-containing protein, partial [Cryomyces antarcticus]